MEDECWQIVDDLEIEMAGFVDLIQNDGPPEAEIVIIGYYQLPDGASGGFNLCNPYVADLNSRYQDLADADPDVTFMVTVDLMDYEQNPERFASDLLHPSPAGAEQMGQRLATVLAGQ
jgi:lysophospholipase L1-like esterase